MNTDTPRTDAVRFKAQLGEFARQLERELNAEIAMRTIANGEINKLNARIRLLDDGIRQSLQEEKAIERELNAANERIANQERELESRRAESAQLERIAQAIAKAFPNVKSLMGSEADHAEQVVAAVADRIKRLEEAGDGLCEVCQADETKFHLADEIESRVAAWNEAKNSK